MGAEFSIPRLLAITPVESDARSLGRLLPALYGIVDAVLLRWPARSARRCFDGASGLAAISERPALFMSDRLDIALAAGLEGVQLKERGVAPARARGQSSDLILGVSRHDARGIAASADADFVVLSPAYPTQSKPGSPGLGVERLAALIQPSPRPVLALGGVEPEQLQCVLGAGAHGVAVLRGILGSPEPVLRAREYRRALDDALDRRGRS